MGLVNFKCIEIRRLTPTEVISNNYTRFLEDNYPLLSTIEIKHIVLNCRKFIESYLPECPYLPIYYFNKISDISKYQPNLLLITLILISVKWIEDNYPNNSGIAKIFNLDKYELNKCELDVLVDLDYSLFISTENYEFFLENRIY